MRRLGFVMVVAAVGCGGKSKETCQREAAELGAFFAKVDVDPPAIAVDEDMHLVPRTDLAATTPQYGPTVNVTATALVFKGHRVDIAGLYDRMVTANIELSQAISDGKFPGPNPPDVRDYLLLIDGTTSWSRVVEVVQAANRAGMTSPTFVFAFPTQPSKPPRAPIDDELDKLGSHNMAGVPAEVMRSVIKGCPAILDVLGQVGTLDRETARFIVTEMPKALATCNCDVNIPNLRSVLWRLLVNRSPVRTLRLDPDAPPEKLALPAATTWKEASQRLTPATKNAELLVE